MHLYLGPPGHVPADVAYMPAQGRPLAATPAGAQGRSRRDRTVAEVRAAIADLPIHESAGALGLHETDDVPDSDDETTG